MIKENILTNILDDYINKCSMPNEPWNIDQG